MLRISEVFPFGERRSGEMEGMGKFIQLGLVNGSSKVDMILILSFDEF